MKVRAGIIGSSGGSALAAAVECIERAGHVLEPVIVVDRDCGMMNWAALRGLDCHKIDFQDVDDFSSEADRIFRDAGCSDVLLYYTRRVAPPLIHERRVWNIHPSLLPAFPGLRAVKQALVSGVRLLGATLIRVDEGLDTGPIVAQVACNLPAGMDFANANRLSYIQKVWLTVNWFEILACGETSVSGGLPLKSGVLLASADIVDPALRAGFLDWLAAVEDRRE